MALPNFRKGVVTSTEGASYLEVASCEVYCNNHYWLYSGCLAFAGHDHERLFLWKNKVANLPRDKRMQFASAVPLIMALGY